MLAEALDLAGIRLQTLAAKLRARRPIPIRLALASEVEALRAKLDLKDHRISHLAASYDTLAAQADQRLDHASNLHNILVHQVDEMDTGLSAFASQVDTLRDHRKHSEKLADQTYDDTWERCSCSHCLCSVKIDAPGGDDLGRCAPCAKADCDG